MVFSNCVTVHFDYSDWPWVETFVEVVMDAMFLIINGGVYNMLYALPAPALPLQNQLYNPITDTFFFDAIDVQDSSDDDVMGSNTTTDGESDYSWESVYMDLDDGD